ncbi:MAG TPA: hypothetical protein VD998_03640 [Verrucomicrobiae bacterium]|nr:hypothetical protein [Verrucomicrobiae bacterium]
MKDRSFYKLMTARFERLGMVDHLILVGLLSMIATFLFPAVADASVANKTDVFEIKNLQTINFPENIEIPGVSKLGKFISDSLNKQTEPEITETPNVADPVATTPPPAPSPAPKAVAKTPAVVKAAALTASYQVPPKATNKVYMHEPEIRAYICPKLGANCNTFIAILKAENGTHECTRDNRGLNRNGSIDIGLTQINWTPKSPYSFEQLQDCKFNLDIALKKYETRGFQPWAAYNSGRYKRHLPAVLAAAAKMENTAN